MNKVIERDIIMLINEPCFIYDKKNTMLDIKEIYVYLMRVGNHKKTILRIMNSVNSTHLQLKLNISNIINICHYLKDTTNIKFKNDNDIKKIDILLDNDLMKLIINLKGSMITDNYYSDIEKYRFISDDYIKFELKEMYIYKQCKKKLLSKAYMNEYLYNDVSNIVFSYLPISKKFDDLIFFHLE